MSDQDRWAGEPAREIDDPRDAFLEATGLPQLEGYFSTERDKDPQPEIHLRPDRRAKYDTVAKVLAAAQRNHMKKIGFVNVAEFGGD